MENAVKWKWRVDESDEKDWGLPTPTPSPTPVAVAVAAPTPEIRPTSYEIKRGDALILIARKFGMTVEQIKAFNGLKNDKIRAGQTLKIPTLAELSAMAPPVKTKKKKAVETPDSRLSTETGTDLEKLRLQIFLDREQFSPGPIAAVPGPDFAKLMLAYETAHEDAKDDAALGAKARASLSNVFAHYKLRAEDFRFIAPPIAEPVQPRQTPGLRRAHAQKVPGRPPPLAPPHLTFEQMVSMKMLAYRSPWEFVAERFHCQESYLHILNDKLPSQPGIGADFIVPDVVPFEIEKALDSPIQPQADPGIQISAAAIGLSQLNIYRNGALIAMFPMSPARPGLHGRGSWTILNAIPRPRMATLQEERTELIKKISAPVPGTTPEPAPVALKTGLSSEQYLPPGPRNPVGIIWINLAKAKSTEALPYGLHGTSIPDRMNTTQSIGGFRLSNWDIARAVRLLPSGTRLDWR
jgi:LysM repeat protein